jgi:hypothetical protein
MQSSVPNTVLFRPTVHGFETVPQQFIRDQFTDGGSAKFSVTQQFTIMSYSRWSMAPIHNITRHQTPLHDSTLGLFIVAKNCEAGLSDALTGQFQPCDVSLIQKPL